MNPDLHFSKFFRNDGGTYLRRVVREALLPECIAPTVKLGGGGVMV